MTSWWGIGPAAIPEPIVGQLNKELGRILQTSDVKNFAVLGVDATTSTSEEFAKLIKAEVTKDDKLIAEIGIESSSGRGGDNSRSHATPQCEPSFRRVDGIQNAVALAARHGDGVRRPRPH